MFTIRPHGNEAVHVFTTDELDKREIAIMKEVEEKLRKQLEPSYSDAYIRQFIGYLTGAIPELHRVEVPRLAKAWQEYRAGDEPRGQLRGAELDSNWGDKQAGGGYEVRNCRIEGEAPVVNEGKPLPPKKDPEAEALWRQTYTASISEHGRITACARADAAVEQFRKRFRSTDLQRETINVNPQRLTAMLKHRILARAACIWTDPDCCERRAVQRLMAHGEDGQLANAVIDFLRNGV